MDKGGSLYVFAPDFMLAQALVHTCGNVEITQSEWFICFNLSGRKDDSDEAQGAVDSRALKCAAGADLIYILYASASETW